jgi:peroxiredoxin
MATGPICDFGWRAPGFVLSGVDGRTHALADLMGPRGTVVAFICNHCPYVVASIGRLADAAREMAPLGVATVAICANDATTHPDDSFENMKAFAARHELPFPYVHDESQHVARAWDAVCTPDYFGLDAEGRLQYRGRLDAGKTAPPPPEAPREMVAAMRLVAETGQGPREQTPSMGCSIKWRAA